MVTTKGQAVEIAAQARRALEVLYGPNLRGVYLYGSGARNELTADSDINIAQVERTALWSLTSNGTPRKPNPTGRSIAFV